MGGVSERVGGVSESGGTLTVPPLPRWLLTTVKTQTRSTTTPGGRVIRMVGMELSEESWVQDVFARYPRTFLWAIILPVDQVF